MTKSYDINYSEGVQVIMNWIGHKGIHFIKTLPNEQQETIKSSTGLLTMLNTKFKQQHNKIALLL